MGIADMYGGGARSPFEALPNTSLGADGKPVAANPMQVLDTGGQAAPAAPESSVGSFYGAPVAQGGEMTGALLSAPAPVATAGHPMDQKRALLAFGLGSPATVY